MSTATLHSPISIWRHWTRTQRSSRRLVRSWLREAPSRARQVVAHRDVLVSTVRPNLNGVALVPASLGTAIAVDGFCVLRPNPTRLDSSYLFHWVKTPNLSLTWSGAQRAPAIPPFLIAPCSRQRFLCPRFRSSDGSPPFSIRRMLCEPRGETPGLARHTRSVHLSRHVRQSRDEPKGMADAGRWANWQRSFQTDPFGSSPKRQHARRHSRYPDSRTSGVGDCHRHATRCSISESTYATLKQHDLSSQVTSSSATMGDPDLRACVQPDVDRIALNKADCVRSRPDMRVCNSDYVCALLNEPDADRHGTATDSGSDQC